MKTPPISHLLRAALAAGVLAACSISEPTSAWETRLAPALCTRAESLLEARDVDGAREAASQALEQAQSQRDVVSEARALCVLGLVDHSPAQLKASHRLLADPPAEEGLWEIRLDLAHLALDWGAPESAEEFLKPVLDAASDWPAPGQRALAEARGYHMLATIRRAEGRLDAAAKHERWASLQLTVLPDHELRDLRLEVAQALGDDCAARGLFQEAFHAHAQAASLARRLGKPRARLKASLCMSRDLVLLDRLTDAVDHFGRTLDLAREMDDWGSVEDIALEALDWLDTRGEPWNSRLRRVFRDTLIEVSARVPPNTTDDSPPPRG
jgi:tetratricopeptide (TPR) repeat protein